MSVTPSSTIVGVFRDHATAEQAIEALYNAGFTQDQIRYSAPGTSGGFLEELKSLFTGTTSGEETIVNDLVNTGLSDDEAHYYAHEYHNGRTILTVNAPGHEHEAVGVLHQFGAYDPPLRSTAATTSAPEQQTVDDTQPTSDSSSATAEPINEVPAWATPVEPLSPEEQPAEVAPQNGAVHDAEVTPQDYSAPATEVADSTTSEEPTQPLATTETAHTEPEEVTAPDLETSEQAEEAPATTTETPEQSDEAPAATEEDSAEPVDEVPAATAETPEYTDEVPVATVETLEYAEEVPVAAVETPEQTDEAPVAAVETPEYTDEAPIAAVETPEYTDEAPIAAVETPEQPTKLLSLPSRLLSRPTKSPLPILKSSFLTMQLPLKTKHQHLRRSIQHKMLSLMQRHLRSLHRTSPTKLQALKRRVLHLRLSPPKPRANLSPHLPRPRRANLKRWHPLPPQKPLPRLMSFNNCKSNSRPPNSSLKRQKHSSSPLKTRKSTFAPFVNANRNFKKHASNCKPSRPNLQLPWPNFTKPRDASLSTKSILYSGMMETF